MNAKCYVFFQPTLAIYLLKEIMATPLRLLFKMSKISPYPLQLLTNKAGLACIITYVAELSQRRGVATFRFVTATSSGLVCPYDSRRHTYIEICEYKDGHICICQIYLSDLHLLQSRVVNLLQYY
jgi:hypothetical protein